MAALKYKNSSGEYVTLPTYTVGQSIIPVQTTGNSEIDVMSQKAVTTELEKKLESVPTASASVIGGVKLGYSQQAYKFPLEIDASGKAFTNVSIAPATDSSSGLLMGHDYSLLRFYDGCNKVTSVANIPLTHHMCIATISANGSFSLSGITSAANVTAKFPAGHEIHVIIKNSGSSDINVTLPSSTIYISTNDVSAITIKAGKYGEINAMSDGTNIYLRAI